MEKQHVPAVAIAVVKNAAVASAGRLCATE
jgi:hypothetical protein